MAVAKFLLNGDAFNFETITVADTAIGCTAATYASNNDSHIRSVMTLAGGVVRYRYDGSNPTASVGHLLHHGDTVVVEGLVNTSNFRVIRAGDTSGTLSVTYEAVNG